MVVSHLTAQPTGRNHAKTVYGPGMTWWLASPSGPRLPIGSLGLLIGRSSECDVVIDHELVSRRHALLQLVGDRLELAVLGRNPVDVNGTPHRTSSVVAEGDRIAIAGVVLSIARGGDHADIAPWLLRAGELAFGVVRLPYTIGGGDADDLVVPECPAAAVTLFGVAGQLFAVAEADGVELAGATLAAGLVEPISDGAVLVVGGTAFTARRSASSAGATRTVANPPDLIDVETLPRGARLTLGFAGRTYALVISELRLSLLAVLLTPPAPHAAGDYVPDQVVFERVWPRNDRVGAGDLNALVHRLRRDLLKAGVDGPALLQRAPGATRIALAPATQIRYR